MAIVDRLYDARRFLLNEAIRQRSLEGWQRVQERAAASERGNLELRVRWADLYEAELESRRHRHHPRHGGEELRGWRRPLRLLAPDVTSLQVRNVPGKARQQQLLAAWSHLALVYLIYPVIVIILGGMDAAMPSSASQARNTAWNSKRRCMERSCRTWRPRSASISTSRPRSRTMSCFTCAGCAKDAQRPTNSPCSSTRAAPSMCAASLPP